MTGQRRVTTRTQPCDGAQARKRLADARLFLELAETVDDASARESLGVSAANAVLAAIAAADAACCPLSWRTLTRRGPSRRDEACGAGAAGRQRCGESARAAPGHQEYGLTTVSRANCELAIRQARRLVEFAEAVVNRTA
jgi:hypothetical protein